jgi:DNA-binding beta-propeller fold protein YncE
MKRLTGYISLLLAACPTGGGAEEIAPVSALTGEAGHRDGVGADSLFNDPMGMARDGEGNLYVCDARNHVIRKISAKGVVTTLAGAPGQPGAADGKGKAARFRFPTDVALAPKGGILYVTDSGNHCIRAISTKGKVTTLAGNLGEADDVLRNYGTADYTPVPLKIDGKRKKARFNSPGGIACSPSGHLYVSDTGNQVIRRIDPKGNVVTLAGSPGAWGSADGSGAAARFHSPQGLCVGADGNIYIADTHNHTIRRMTPAGVVTTFSGNASESGRVSGPRLEARYSAPTDIVPHPDGGFIICDSFCNSLFRLDATDAVSPLAGIGEIDSPPATGDLSGPQSVVSDPKGNVFVADTFNQEVRLILVKLDSSISTNGDTTELTLAWDSIPGCDYQLQTYGPQGWESTGDDPIRASATKTSVTFPVPGDQDPGLYRMLLLGL